MRTFRRATVVEETGIGDDPDEDAWERRAEAVRLGALELRGLASAGGDLAWGPGPSPN